jgi:uncharacterized membrane protein (UPF0127 family)
MQQRTKMFIGLIIAMAVLLFIAWYTWPQETTPVMVAPTTPVSDVSTTSPALVATSTAATSTPAASSFPPPSLGEGNGLVTIDGQTIYVDLAETDAQQELGLGNRSSLGAHQGMLFTFPNDAQHEFWMKDMSFSIDMVWFSADGTVIYIQPNVAPSTYPDAFGPDQVSRYVLELPANFAAEYGIKVGDKATLP